MRNRETRTFYTPKKDNVQKRAENQFGNSSRDSFVKDNFKFFKPHDGENKVRILPPTWENPEHYGLDIYVHYQVGPDKASYLCPQKMEGKACPICEARAKAESAGDKDYASSLKPSHRVMVWCVDKKAKTEDVGKILIWTMPWTLDKDLCALSVDKETGELLDITNVDKGYDVFFQKEGKTPSTTKYVGVSIARNSSSVDDDAISFVLNNPLNGVLIYHSYDRIKGAFSGAAKEVDDEAVSESDTKSEEAAIATLGLEHLKYEDVIKMSTHELDMAADQLSISITSDMDDVTVATMICEKLGLKKAEPAPVSATTKSRMDAMRERLRK